MDYILTDRKHYGWSRDAEANDSIDMGSDHRCVMAKFEIPTKKATRRSKALPVVVERETCDDEHEKLYRDHEQEVKDAEPKKAQKIPKAQAADAEATTVTAVQAVVMVATAALAAAADGQTIKKNIAEAAEKI